MTLEEEKAEIHKQIEGLKRWIDTYRDEIRIRQKSIDGCNETITFLEERLSQIERVDESLDKKKPWK